MANKKSDSKIIGMVREAHRLADVSLNAIDSRLVEGHKIHGLANALIAGRHVTAGSGSAPEVDHAGTDPKSNSLLDEAYGTDGERSSGSY
jgi:hypothetical protein